ncbi:hypothetical protein H6F77_25430 [Microcoleus sp. FACHB-831]|uniref:hypothetical protein n=1 Tax=Microcoleus sp. FACHB-831 TaxID=2692827 RepID=UPI001689D9C0|nr:hypothetical protein [Microcoleus sp. FACHB-831]MBD1924386.1 hypothetical protein [Microcoleus sp. FACHB-831]
MAKFIGATETKKAIALLLTKRAKPSVGSLFAPKIGSHTAIAIAVNLMQLL